MAGPAGRQVTEQPITYAIRSVMLQIIVRNRSEVRSRFFQGVVMALVLASCGGGGGDKSGTAQSLGSPFSPSATQSEQPDAQLADVKVLNGVSVPPQPDAAANATLLGVDSNGNGVRDDVERVLAAQYGTEYFEGLMQVGKAEQDVLAARITEPENIVAARNASLRTIYCLRKKDPRITYAMLQFVSLATHNSQERRKAVVDRQSAMAGTMLTLDNSPC